MSFTKETERLFCEFVRRFPVREFGIYCNVDVITQLSRSILKKIVQFERLKMFK